MALISPKSVERKCGVSTADLSRWRRSGRGPHFYRISPRLVRYGTDDLEEWFRDPRTNAYTVCLYPVCQIYVTPSAVSARSELG